MKKVELLAPAGNMEAFKAAINNGADAIYLGLNSFNARIKANNFTVDNISSIVRLAHLFNVKIYVTINTIIKDQEVEEFLTMIDSCVKAKVDAYIVQDLGVAYLLLSNYEGIVLHASTQMGVHNLYGAKVLEKIGFKRVVLSREATYQDIVDIKNHTNLEIEFFVQGALCVSFSGNCYMSSFISSDSGNRGRCKQFCRKKYVTFNNEEKLGQGYYLSCKDLCLANELKALREAGVCSFKIEGRMRREGYVASAVNVYRHLIDENYRLIDKKETDTLKTAFSRGEFNYKAYLNGENGRIINEKNQNHLGIKIGRLLKVSPFKNGLYELEIESSHPLSSGDGLKFMKGNEEVASLGVGNVLIKKTNVYKIFTKQKIKDNNLDVYLTLNKLEEDKLLEKQRKLDLKVKVIALKYQKLRIELSSNNVKCSYESDCFCPEAINKPTSLEEIYNQISKLNDTNFVLDDFSGDIDNVFIVKSALNDLRRKGIEKLENLIISKNESYLKVQKIAPKYLNHHLLSLGDSVIINDIIDLNDLDKEYSGVIIYAPNNYNNLVVKDLNTLKEEFKLANVALNLPLIAFKEDLKIIDTILAQISDIYLVANNIYGLYYVDKYPLIAGYNLNIINSFALNLLNNLGVGIAFASLENNIEMFNKNANLYYYGFGYNTLMNYVHCPFKTIYHNECKNCSYHENLSYKDDHNKSYKLRRYKVNHCFFELINDEAINVYKKINNPTIVDLRYVINKSETIKMINNRRYKSIEPHETYGLFFKNIN